MLELHGLEVAYGPITALHGISLQVEEGGVTTLVGANGAGKTTLLRAISGLVPARSGRVIFAGEDVTNLPPHAVVACGLAHVPEGRLVFPQLSVRENLALGAYLRRDRAALREDEDYLFTLFPRLRERITQPAGTLSGGEQQMLAIARALMGRPRFLMLDEPSLGIAPILTRAIFATLAEIHRDRGLGILLVEQNVNLALDIAARGAVLETGRLVLEGPAAELRADPRVRAAYLGG
jgi:branched-chain amino acid transport system ATP-binding protein